MLIKLNGKNIVGKIIDFRGNVYSNLEGSSENKQKEEKSTEK